MLNLDVQELRNFQRFGQDEDSGRCLWIRICMSFRCPVRQRRGPGRGCVNICILVGFYAVHSSEPGNAKASERGMISSKIPTFFLSVCAL